MRSTCSGLSLRCCCLQVLLRALRDFNLGKLTADDTGIFLGLLNDLFPKTAEQVPRAIDHAFEPKVWTWPLSSSDMQLSSSAQHHQFDKV